MHLKNEPGGLIPCPESDLVVRVGQDQLDALCSRGEDEVLQEVQSH